MDIVALTNIVGCYAVTSSPGPLIHSLFFFTSFLCNPDQIYSFFLLFFVWSGLNREKE